MRLCVYALFRVRMINFLFFVALYVDDDVVILWMKPLMSESTAMGTYWMEVVYLCFSRYVYAIIIVEGGREYAQRVMNWLG